MEIELDQLDALDAIAPVQSDTEQEPNALQLFEAWCDKFLQEQESEAK